MKDNAQKIILSIIEQNPLTRDQFNHFRSKICGKLNTIQLANNNLLSAYQLLLKKKRIEQNPLIESFLKKSTVRTLSGVAIITSLTKPYSCPGKCVFCPTEARMPKSYLASEPAAARAFGLKFNPYEQMKQRIEMLETNGHLTDKIEFIVKGGSWNAYPLKYQYWFILESFRACNLKIKSQKSKVKSLNELSLSELQKLLIIEQTKNEKSKHRIVGLTLETRPDLITSDTIYHMRQMGCTRVELGLQTPDDKILALNKRGHTVQQFKDAMLLLRQAGFKVDLHFMPGLPGSTAKHDVEMYRLLFSDPGLKPDMVKIYPCSVVKSAELYDWWKQGKFKPYSQKKLFEALIEMKIATPLYCRISRLIRDIPDNEIEAGNKVTNLRQNLKAEMEKRGLKCECLRCREVGHVDKSKIKNQKSKIRIFVEKYETIGGDEYFLSFEDKKREIVFGFLRLRLPNHTAALVRELHVYGQLVQIGKQKSGASQHTGLGKKLLLEAERIAKKTNYKKIAVISGVGVRDYYRKFGYRKQRTYMIKELIKK